MPRSGETRAEGVLGEPRARGVCRSTVERDGKQVSTLVKGDTGVALLFPPMVGRGALEMPQRRLGIPIHPFCHPLMAPMKDVKIR